MIGFVNQAMGIAIEVGVSGWVCTERDREIWGSHCSGFKDQG